MSWRVLEGDCLDVLRTLDPASVQTVVTSPPYWGLRNYGVDGQLGLEPTPEEYVQNLVEVFREVRRVLRDDGTVWLNLGDSYCSTAPGTANTAQTMNKFVDDWRGVEAKRPGIPVGLKPKDLVGIPWRVAFALQADGWVLRSEIVWSKSNPMPESVTDRPTRAHEQIFLFSKAKWTGAEEPISMSRVDAAWLAALVDGEGTICFQDRTSKGASTPTYSVRLSIVNSHRGLLERVVEICGLADVGAPSPRWRNDSTAGRSVYSWQLTNAKGAKVIGAIRPYLIAKGTQADLALAVQALNRKHVGRGGYKVSAADATFKRRCAEACSALNHGEQPDLSWFTPAKAGRWVSQPYMYDADAIREGSTGQNGAAAMFYRDSQSRLERSRPHHGDRVVGHEGRPVEREDTGFRNRRSVWEIATQPYPDAHFATFPPKLVEPCILAGSPPKCCGECGAPRVRDVDVSYENPGNRTTNGPRSVDNRDFSAGFEQRLERRTETLGWKPTCDHDDDSGSAVVLDPFAGAGTTGVVALRHNRSFIGIELNPTYAEMARNRIRDDAPLLNGDEAYSVPQRIPDKQSAIGEQQQQLSGGDRLSGFNERWKNR